MADEGVTQSSMSTQQEQAANAVAEQQQSDSLGRIIEHLVALGMTGARYRVQEQIAQGGMGTIYRAYDQGLTRTNVLKVLRPEIQEKLELVGRFVEEARITAQLEHPNIIPVHDMGVLEGNRLFFSMKFIQGEELGWIIKKLRAGDAQYAKDFSLFSLLIIVRKVCDAVAFAHSQGILHRDIKPDNIMIGDFGEVLLVDWGLARRLGTPEYPAQDRELQALSSEEIESATIKTRDGIIKGTPAYMSPEQARGQADLVDQRSDVFLLGATLYAVATLHAPITGDDVYEMVTNAEKGKYIPPQQRAPKRDIPDELARIILKAMAHDPQERYQTVRELSADLDALMEGRAVSERKSFAAGEVLMTEGEVGGEAYVILSGEVVVYKTIGGKKVHLVNLKAGDAVGEMALLSKAPRSATVKAVLDTEVVVITEDLMKQGLAKLPPWMSRAVGALVGRLRTANVNVHPLMTGDCRYHVLNQIRLLYPHWAVPRRDEETGRLVLVINAGELVAEIATTLCLVRERVAMIVSRLLDTPLVKVVGNNDFYIVNYELFNYFVDLIRVKQGVDTFLADERTSLLFAGNEDVWLSLSLKGHTVEQAPELEPTHSVEPHELLACASTDDIPAALEQVYDYLSDSASPLAHHA